MVQSEEICSQSFWPVFLLASILYFNQHDSVDDYSGVISSNYELNDFSVVENFDGEYCSLFTYDFVNAFGDNVVVEAYFYSLDVSNVPFPSDARGPPPFYRSIA